MATAMTTSGGDDDIQRCSGPTAKSLGPRPARLSGERGQPRSRAYDPAPPPLSSVCARCAMSPAVPTRSPCTDCARCAWCVRWPSRMASYVCRARLHRTGTPGTPCATEPTARRGATDRRGAPCRSDVLGGTAKTGTPGTVEHLRHPAHLLGGPHVRTPLQRHLAHVVRLGKKHARD